MTTPPRLGSVLGLATIMLTPLAVGADHWVFFGTYTGANSKGIYRSRLADDGTLSAPELAATTPSPAFLAIDPAQRFLYAAIEVGEFQGENAGGVGAYALDASTGALTLINQQSAVTRGPCHIAVDHTGGVVLVANYGGGSVQSYRVRGDGGLDPAASVIRLSGSSVNRDRQNEPHSHCVGVDPANRFALLCDLGLDQVLVFKLDPATATLAPNDPPFARTPPGAGPRHFAFRPDGKFVYVINELDCTLTTFAYDAARGALTVVETVSTLPAGTERQSNYSTAEIVVHPSGKFVYGSNRRHDTLVVFAIDEASGRLTLVEHVSSGGKVPRNFNIDPTGRYLLSANQETGNVIVMRIDASTGRLTSTGAQVELERPVCVVFAPVR